MKKRGEGMRTGVGRVRFIVQALCLGGFVCLALAAGLGWWSPVPYDRNAAGVGEVGHYKRHLGIYAYRKDFLMKYTALEPSFLEQTEKLEQLRAIENGYTILTGMVEKAWDGVDTEQQYQAFVERMTKS